MPTAQREEEGKPKDTIQTQEDNATSPEDVPEGRHTW